MSQSREQGFARRMLTALAIVAAALMLAACVVYEPVPVPQGPSGWSAVRGSQRMT